MAVELEIRDGDPWWLSPDIWTVPGDDPEGPPGTPIAGGTTYLWASVRNNGSTAAENATVRFYWADPSTGFDRSTANFIGNANVSLMPGQVSDVLCLTPWATTFVNGGHECVLAEAFHASDPLPAGLAFNVTTDRHVAQRNLNVAIAMKKQFSLSFGVQNNSRKARAFRVVAEAGTLAQLRKSAGRSDKAIIERARDGKIARMTISDQRCPTEAELARNVTKIDGIKIGPRGRVGFTLAGTIEGASAVVHIRQFDGEHDVGGLSVLVLDQ